MKSLNDNPFTNNFLNKFSSDIVKHIESEGFVLNNNDSYCCDIDNYFDKCYKKTVGSSTYSIFVYIFENAIGVDFDYDCGGNSFNRLWKFEDYTFEEAYDYMVEEVNRYK